MVLAGFDSNHLLEDCEPLVEADEDVHALFEELTAGHRKCVVREMRRDETRSGVISIPEEVADPSLEADAWEDIRRTEIVIDGPHTIVGEHRLSELIQTLAPRIPPRRNDEGQVAGIKCLRLLDKVLVDRRRARP